MLSRCNSQCVKRARACRSHIYVRAPASTLGVQAEAGFCSGSHQKKYSAYAFRQILTFCFDLHWKEAETYRNVHQKHLNGGAFDAGQASSKNLAPSTVRIRVIAFDLFWKNLLYENSSRENCPQNEMVPANRA